MVSAMEKHNKKASKKHFNTALNKNIHVKSALRLGVQENPINLDATLSSMIEHTQLVEDQDDLEMH